jgi:hypothetical protein
MTVPSTMIRRLNHDALVVAPGTTVNRVAPIAPGVFPPGTILPTARPPQVITPPEPVNVSSYKTYYYTGGQAQVYMGDVFLDEITSMQFSTVTNKTPIFGYASKRFDTIAAGNLLVQGTFTINFVSSGYLPIIAQSIEDKKQSGTGSEPENGIRRRGGATLLQDEYYLAQTINQIRGLGNEEFRKYSKQLQDEKKARGQPLKQFYDIPPFDIYAVFGDSDDPNANSTTRNIKEVYLTGQSQVISTDDGVLQEQYSFLAKDIE